jgi:predicted DCC family thiol-disulfide oxidoreductase YuxK
MATDLPQQVVSDEPTSAHNSLTVFYDGSCPLCRREIAWYQKQRGSQSIQWDDVSQVDDGTLANGLCTEQAMRRFHVQLPDGGLKSGALAFAEVWKSLPRFRWLGILASLPVVRTIAELTYRGFLKIRPAMQRWFS